MHVWQPSQASTAVTCRRVPRTSGLMSETGATLRPCWGAPASSKSVSTSVGQKAAQMPQATQASSSWVSR